MLRTSLKTAISCLVLDVSFVKQLGVSSSSHWHLSLHIRSSSTTQSRNCTCGTSSVLWTVCTVGTWRCITTGTSTIRSTIRFEVRSWRTNLDQFRYFFHDSRSTSTSSLPTLTPPAMSRLNLLMWMALPPFESASDRRFVRSRQSSCATPRSWHRAPRPNPLNLSALSAKQKQDHSFATHTN